MKIEIVDQIILYEKGDLSREETINLFKELYRTNALWNLQGHYQRTFLALCEQGIIDLEELKALQTI